MEEITDDNFEEILLKRHSKFISKQPKQDLEDNLDIMAKKMTKEQLDSLSNAEEKLGKPGLITDGVLKRKNKYEPEIYEKKEKFIEDLLIFGIQCNKGWFYLIDAVMDLIEGHIARIDEVKEKYGRLEIYIFGDDYAYDVVSRASDLSEAICEECGKQITKKTMYEHDKNYKPGSWIYTLCDTCMANPKKSFPMSSNHVKKEEIKKYLEDENYAFIKVKDFIEMSKNGTIDKRLIINMIGEISMERNNYVFNDDTGKIVIYAKRTDSYLKDNINDRCYLENCYPVVKDGKIILGFSSIVG